MDLKNRMNDQSYERNAAQKWSIQPRD